MNEQTLVVHDPLDPQDEAELVADPKGAGLSVHLEELVNEIKAILTERHYEARLQFVGAKWDIGQAIYKHPDYTRYKRTPKNLIQQLSEVTHMDLPELYRSVQFYKKFPAPDFETALSKLPEGKRLSWSSIKRNLLPDSKATQLANPVIPQEEAERALLAVCKRLRRNRIPVSNVKTREQDGILTFYIEMNQALAESL